MSKYYIPFYKRETSFFGRQRLNIFTYFMMAIIFGLILSLSGFSGPQNVFNVYLNAGFLVLMVFLIVAYWLNKISIYTALVFGIMVSQTSTCIEMLYCAFYPDEYNLMLIIGDMVILAVNILVSLLAYLKYSPYTLCAISIATYLVCVFVTGNESLGNFAGTFIVVFIMVCILGNRLVKNMRVLDIENITLKQDEEQLLELLGQNKEQIQAFEELARERHGADVTASLYNHLSEDMKRNVVLNVKEHLARQETEMLEMKEIFPELSASEREVCLLVLQGKKLSEICNILDKSESNITSTRTHIRRKLNMGPQESLKAVLEQRVKEKSPAGS